MIRFTKSLNVVVNVVTLLVLLSISIGLIPWYMQENPMQIVDRQNHYAPGDAIRVTFNRRALIGFQGEVTRELVRIDPTSGAVEEIWKSSIDTSIGRGSKTIVLTYNIPTLAQYPTMVGNTYMWQGCMTYRPFGLIERTFFFYTEPFTIRLREHKGG